MAFSIGGGILESMSDWKMDIIDSKYNIVGRLPVEVYKGILCCYSVVLFHQALTFQAPVAEKKVCIIIFIKSTVRFPNQQCFKN